MKLKDNNNIFCSVSAGYSSVMMAIMLPTYYPNHNIIYAMANTSKDRSESLHFMNECDKYYGFNMAWIEAEFHENGVGVTPRVISYEDLKRKGEVFESGINKLGIPSKINKWCNRDMKLDPLKKYADNIFGKNNYSIAVGLRIDEMDRVRKDFLTNNVFYPLMDNNVDSKARNKFWKDQPIQINIPAFKGNCDLCFAKSNRKLTTILKEDPKVGDWWNRMVEEYGDKPKPTSKSYTDILNKLLDEDKKMTFYRGYNSVKDLVKMAQKPFSKATDEYVYENDLMDSEDECGSGCSVF